MEFEHKQLFIPGPTEVAPEVLDEMARPLIGHRTKEISELQKAISEKVQQVFYTNNTIILSTSSGSGLMEAAVRSCTAKRALCCSMGDFGTRWYKMAVSNNIPADIIEVPLGQHVPVEAIDEALATGKYDLLTTTHSETATGVVNNLVEIAEMMKKYPDVVWCVDSVSAAAGMKVEVDALGIDIFLTSSHKAFALPPGLAICSMSQKAYDRTADVPFRGTYFDLRALHDRVVKKNFQYTSTPNVSLMFALDKQLDRILEEGIENRFNRHTEMAEYTRAWASKYFDLFAEEGYRANTLTVVKNTREISVADLNKALAQRGKTLANGYGDLKEKTFRIAHMGEITLDDIKALLKDIEEILELA